MWLGYAMCGAEHRAAGSFDRALKVWDAITGQNLLSLKGHTDWVSSVAFNHDGKRIISGSLDKTVKVWDAHTGKALLTLTGHAERVFSVSYSPARHCIFARDCGISTRFVSWSPPTSGLPWFPKPPRSGVRNPWPSRWCGSGTLPGPSRKRVICARDFLPRPAKLLVEHLRPTRRDNQTASRAHRLHRHR